MNEEILLVQIVPPNSLLVFLYKYKAATCLEEKCTVNPHYQEWIEFSETVQVVSKTGMWATKITYEKNNSLDECYILSLVAIAMYDREGTEETNKFKKIFVGNNLIFFWINPPPTWNKIQSLQNKFSDLQQHSHSEKYKNE